MKESYINISGPTTAIIHDEVVLERSQRVGLARHEYFAQERTIVSTELGGTLDTANSVPLTIPSSKSESHRKESVLHFGNLMAMAIAAKSAAMPRKTKPGLIVRLLLQTAIK